MAQRMICKASVQPHQHNDEMRGPLDLKIGYRHQPYIVRGWLKSKTLRIRLEQPDERTNLTIIKLLFGACTTGSKDRWYNINQCRSKTNMLKCYIKGRITDKMEHPIPVGRYEGTCEWGENWCLFTLQSVSLVLKQEEPKIVLPDGSLPGRIVVP